MGSVFSDMERMHNEMEKSFRQMFQPQNMDFESGFGSARQQGASSLDSFKPDGNVWESRSFSNMSQQRKCENGVCVMVTCQNGKCTESSNGNARKMMSSKRQN